MKTPGDGSSTPRGDDEGPYVSPLVSNLDENTRLMQRAVRMALLAHKKLGNPVVVWDEERGPVWLAPEDIPVDESEFEGEPLLPPWG